MINNFPLTGSGSGVYVQNLTNALINQDHEVCVIFPENEAFNDSEYDYKCHPIYFTKDDGTKPNVNEKILPFNYPCMSTHPRSIFNFRDLTKEQEQQYCDAFENAINEEIQNFEPDIIHCGHIWISAAIASQFDVPLIITCHGTDIQAYEESDRFHHYCEQAVKSCCSIICISDKNEIEAKKYFPAQSGKILKMPNGYNSHIFYPQKYDKKEVLSQFGITKNFEHIVSFAGKFTHFKGIDVLLKAASLYEKDNIATILAGDGALFEEMNELSAKLQLKNVFFVHNQTHKMLRRLYNIADVSLVPSRNEPFGLVVIEANACGTPVIGTNDGGIANILTDETGILINPEDYKNLAKGVTDIVEGTRIFNRQTCATVTQQKFSQDSLILHLIDLYNKFV